MNAPDQSETETIPECEDCEDTGYVHCPDCDGSGFADDANDCETCEGEGSFMCEECDAAQRRING